MIEPKGHSKFVWDTLEYLDRRIRKLEKDNKALSKRIPKKKSKGEGDGLPK